MVEQVHVDEWVNVFSGDCRDVMRTLPEKSVHTIVTSPPYYGLREYGTATWDGGDPDCDHTKAAAGRGSNIPQTKNPNADYPIAPHRGGNPNECVKCGAIRIEPTIWGGDADHAHEWGEDVVKRRSAGGERDYGSSDGGVGRGPAVALPASNFCECGAWRGALGLEPTPDLYVEHLVEVFREAWRVLRDDGILWLNLGDSFATSGGHTKQGENSQRKGRSNVGEQNRLKGSIPAGVKPKDLLGVPWLAAFALRNDGWYLRQDIVWSKPNAMPESVEDRPARSHEFIFMLTKNPRYFYDHIAVLEPPSEATIRTVTAKMAKAPIEDREYQHDTETRMGKRSPNRVWSDADAMGRLLDGRNLRDVWSIPTVSYPGAHYATFPRKLVEPMIKSSTSEKGCCPECGAPWVRVIASESSWQARKEGGAIRGNLALDGNVGAGTQRGVHGVGVTHDLDAVKREMVGWKPTCDHTQPTGVYPDEYLGGALEADGETPLDPVPCTVLDPFGGSGTVAMVAQQLGRRAISIDLNPEYVEQQMIRNLQVPLGL